MKVRPRTVFRAAAALVALFVVAGLTVPQISADKYGNQLKWSLQRALGREVQINGKVSFTLFGGPGLSAEDILIKEDPSIGIEPMAYVGTMVVRPSLWGLLRGRFVIASVRLEDDVSINLAKTGQGSEFGRWNFASFVNPSVMSAAPAIHVRNGRIHFKFGDTKSVFYLTETDLDISPPRTRSGGWKVYCSGKPARTDRPAQGLGSFTISGRWYVAPESVDLDLELERTGLGELTALVRGQSGNVHGTATSRLHFGGPIRDIGIQGRLTIEDVHRWDLMPPQGEGWPIDVRGRLNLLTQQLELQSTSAANTTPPLSVRFRVTDYLSKPHWALAVNWNRFPVAPLMALATHMGAQFPPKLQLAGTMDGAIGYSGDEGRFQGQLAFHKAALTIPDSPPIRFDEAYLIVDHGHVRLSPAVVHIEESSPPRSTAEAGIEADYDLDSQALDLSLSTDGMQVASLRSQVALAAVPWLEQLRTGEFRGRLNYRRDPESAGWTGSLDLSDAEIPLPGLANPVQLNSAHAQIDGSRVVLDQIDAVTGKIALTGEYRYEPAAARRHRLRVRIDEADVADLEAELMPTLQRSPGLIARALGRSSLPPWLAGRQLDATLQIGDLALGDVHAENVRARLVWDGVRVELDGLQARLDNAAISGKLAINLRGSRPVYKLTGKLKGVNWQSGKVDADGTLETSGTGAQALANLTADFAFSGSALDFGGLSPWRSVTGNASLAWSPRLHLTGLSVKAEDETYTLRGTTLEDGRLVILLANGDRQMRMTGTLAKLKVEDTGRP